MPSWTTLTQWLTQPWYTWLAASVVGLVLVGLLAAVIKLVMAAMTGLLMAAWVGGRQLLWALTGWQWLQPSTCGTAYWAWSRNVRDAGLLRDEGLPLGTWKGHVLREPSGGHVALYGAPRSWKSTGCLMPAIEQYQGSVVVNDLRGELYTSTHEARERQGPVLRYAPESKDSCSLNVLDNVAWHTDEEFTDLLRIANGLVPQAKDNDPTFRQHAVPLLIALMIYVQREGEGHLPAVLGWMDSPTMTMDQKLDVLLHFPHPHVQSGANGVLSLSENMRKIAWGIVQSALVVFRNPRVAAHSQTSDILFADLVSGPSPVTLYLCFRLRNIKSMGALLGAIIDTLVAVVGDPEDPPQHHTLLALDECANLGYLQQLQDSISYLQGSGVQVLTVWQNEAQVQDLYGENARLLASVATKIYYRPEDQLTAEVLSTRVGQSTVMASVMQDGIASSAGQMPRGRPLLFADEALRMPQTQAIILVSGQPPIRAIKLGVRVAPPEARLLHRLVGTVRQRVQYHPWGYATAGAVLVLACMLWPLRHTYQAAPTAAPVVVASTPITAVPPVQAKAISEPMPIAPTPPTVVTPPVGLPVLDGSTPLDTPAPAPSPTRAPHSYTLLFRMVNPGGRVAQQERVATYPTVEACGRALHAKYEPAIAALVDLGKGGRYTVAQQKGPYYRSWQTQENRGTSFGVINEASCVAERAGAQTP